MWNCSQHWGRRGLQFAILIAGAFLTGCSGKLPDERSDVGAADSVAPTNSAPGSSSNGHNAAPTSWQQQGPARVLEPGIVFESFDAVGTAIPSRIWFYRPEPRPAGKLSCILIAAAGSRLFHGMQLGEGDIPEHLPYVRAGFAVIAFELDGALSDQPSNSEIWNAAIAFKSAQAGLSNARAALDFLATHSDIDAGHIYAVGHSSAATLALHVAAKEPRIHACIAYAPCCDVVGRLGDAFVDTLSSEIPGYRTFIEASSPIQFADALRCPTFVFCADDDANIRPEEVKEFVETIRNTNGAITYVTVPTGNHYDSMIKEGIPRGIAWINSLEGATIEQK